MNKRTLATIFLFGILNLSDASVFAGSLNQIDVSEIMADSIYKVQTNIRLKQFSEKEILVNETPYQILTIPEYGYTSEVGKPKLPAGQNSVKLSYDKGL